MSIPTFLEIAGLRIPIVDCWGGPQIDLSGALEPVTWVVNHWVQGKFPDLLDGVERGEDAMKDGFGASRPDPEDITDERKAVWRNLAGTDLGHDPVLVGSLMTYPSVLLPRSTLIEILHVIAKVRADAATCLRLPPVPEPAPADGMPPVAQLFTQTPTNQPPRDFERIALGDVEDLATALDAAQASATTETARATAAAKRREFLGKLDFFGLLDEARVHEKRAFLEGFRLPKLRDYVDAAMAQRAYYRSPARAKYSLGPAPQRLLDGNVSLDWFRVPSPIPAGESPESWLAFVEHLLQETPRKGEAGEIFTSVAARQYEICWRRDCEQPAVVATRESLAVAN